MNIQLNGMRALVCGSSQGIGKATAQLLAAAGASITLFSRNEEKLASVLSSLDIGKGQSHEVLIADFTDPDSVQAALSNYDKDIQIVVNNTGGPAPGPAHQANIDAYRAAFNLHLISNQIIVQHCIPAMREARFGRIINIISTSVKQPIPGLGVSNTIRGAVANWAKTLASELGPDGITVNNVLPGATDTVRLEAIITNKAKKQGKNEAEVIEEEKLQIPLRRFAKAEEIAAAVTFLASPQGAYINGVNLPVDGGRTQCL